MTKRQVAAWIDYTHKATGVIALAMSALAAVQLAPATISREAIQKHMELLDSIRTMPLRTRFDHVTADAGTGRAGVDWRQLG